MTYIKMNHKNIRLTEIAKNVRFFFLNSRQNGTVIEFKTLLTPFKVLNYSLCVSSA